MIDFFTSQYNILTGKRFSCAPDGVGIVALWTSSPTLYRLSHSVTPILCVLFRDDVHVLWQLEVVKVVKQEQASPTKKHKHRLSNFEDVYENTGEGTADFRETIYFMYKYNMSCVKFAQNWHSYI